MDTDTIVKALYDLFQACADLPPEEMDRMNSEINAAGIALAEYAGYCDALYDGIDTSYEYRSEALAAYQKGQTAGVAELTLDAR